MIDRLRTEGVTKGEGEAEALIKQARKQSMEILDQARKVLGTRTETETVEEALEMAFERGGRNQKIYLMPQGSSALPKLREDS